MFNPKIYIRDYGAPTYRMLVRAGRLIFSGHDAGILRHLVIRAENPIGGPEVLLLSGDAQSGGDALSLTGETGRLNLTTAELMRIIGGEVTISLNERLLLTGDAQSGGDLLALSGDAQTGDDALKLTSSS